MLKLSQILCPTDFSALSFEALRIAGQFAARFQARLDVLHIVEPDQPINSLVLSHREAINTASQNSADKQTTPATASRKLHSVIAKNVAMPQVVIPRSLTRMGKPSHEIVTTAQEEGSDLIVMGTHGVTGWRHMIIGSVAETVVRTAPCPVLTIRETREESDFCVEEPRKILCSTDFSEASYEGVDFAGDLARKFGAELILMHALEPFTGYSGLVLEPVEIESFTLADMTQQLQAVLEVRAPDGVQTRPLATWGGAADGIVEAAQKEKADLIVIATHGVTGWRHLLLGSVAETVVRTATCPVLSVPVSRPVTAYAGHNPAATPSWKTSSETD